MTDLAHRILKSVSPTPPTPPSRSPGPGADSVEEREISHPSDTTGSTPQLDQQRSDPTSALPLAREGLGHATEFSSSTASPSPAAPARARGDGSSDSVGGSPDVVFIVDSRGTILYVNRSLPGVSQDDVLGTAIYDYLLPEHHDAVRGENRRVFATATPGGYEVLGMAAQQSNEWYDCRVVPTERGGRVVSATIIARDITARKRVEEELRRELDGARRKLLERTAGLQRAGEALRGQTTEWVRREFQLARFRGILDQAGEAIFITDPPTGRIIDANDTACRWLGEDLEGLTKKTEPELHIQFPLRVPEDFGDHVTETRDSARPQIFQGTHRRDNGTTFPVEVAVTHHHFGDQEYVLAIARDAKGHQLIKEALKESEDKYRALFELSRDAIYLSYRDGTVAEVNDAAIALFGFGRMEFMGYPAKKLYSRAEDVRAFQKEVARNGFVRDMEVTFLDKHGSSFRGLLTTTLRHAGDGNVLGYQCVIRKAVTKPQRPLPPSRQQVETAEGKGHGTLLLVEDDPLVRGDIKQVLELAGIRVLVAESLSEGLVIFRSRAKEIGAVLLAASPHDIASDEAFTEIRRVAPDARIVLLSDAPEQTIVEHLATGGLSGIVRKPFHPLALIQQVRDALEVAHPPTGDQTTVSNPSEAAPGDVERSSRGMPSFPDLHET